MEEDELDGKSVSSEGKPISNSMLFNYLSLITTISIVIGAGHLRATNRWVGM
jgi:hypothetical protein